KRQAKEALLILSTTNSKTCVPGRVTSVLPLCLAKGELEGVLLLGDFPGNAQQRNPHPLPLPTGAARGRAGMQHRQRSAGPASGPRVIIFQLSLAQNFQGPRWI